MGCVSRVTRELQRLPWARSVTAIFGVERAAAVEGHTYRARFLGPRDPTPMFDSIL